MTLRFVLLAAALAATATSQNICGAPLGNIDAYGDEIASSPKKVGDDYACCNQCAAQPECVAFVEGGTNTEQHCRLLRKVITLEKIQTYLTFKGFYYKTIFMKGREAPNWGKCGDKSGFQGCNAGFYCQPWEPNYYQCVVKPASQCTVETNVDLYGGDIKSVSGLNPGACCDECLKTDDCTAYTFVNDAPEGPQCYLKSGNTDRQTKFGAISAYVSKQ